MPTARFIIPPPEVAQQTPRVRCVRARASAMKATPTTFRFGKHGLQFAVSELVNGIMQMLDVGTADAEYVLNRTSRAK